VPDPWPATPAGVGHDYARVMPHTLIRGFRPADEPHLYEICLRTGDAGRDATGQYVDPRLLGHVYVGPYLALSPEHVHVLEFDRIPVGFAVGTADTAAFEAACELRWWPSLRTIYPDPVGVPAPERTPDQEMAFLIHHPETTPDEIVHRYPAHLHIDLLPVAQGQGYGRRLMARLLDGLAGVGAGGVHLGVDLGNPRAIDFYHRLGFVEIATEPGGVLMGLGLPADPSLVGPGPG
jgi:GNAT superfamily N-acetyltransferase